ncbi:Anti sigma-E protein RseA, N-terminal domain [Marinospirillum celere]|uniref:Anti sigma-E protein RseA, N-terminal domain n=1 Tax=Marinospirillum celere TaxID=1122252 RepID=A0A1I1FSV7_9GAMM|nr:sigma-E factor negative regulatory protein [Marinospirillum celere]SFC02649.1 Anti sigma-E protein RseA, N-terminal domain [Marinospirillum celere]
MTERLHQSLSSIMDAAGDDLELPRLLNSMQESPELGQQLGEKWRRYHLAQAILQGDLRGTEQIQAAQVDISDSVMQQLDLEMDASAPQATENLEETLTEVAAFAQAANDQPADSKPLKQRNDRYQWFRGSALAASVALLVITGVQVYNASRDVVQPGGVNTLATQQGDSQQQRQAAQSVSAAADDFRGPLLQASSSPSSPFSPHAFTGRSLVSYGTGVQPLQSRQERTEQNFSPAERQPLTVQPAASR